METALCRSVRCTMRRYQLQATVSIDRSRTETLKNIVAAFDMFSSVFPSLPATRVVASGPVLVPPKLSGLRLAVHTRGGQRRVGILLIRAHARCAMRRAHMGKSSGRRWSLRLCTDVPRLVTGGQCCSCETLHTTYGRPSEIWSASRDQTCFLLGQRQGTTLMWVTH